MRQEGWVYDAKKHFKIIGPPLSKDEINAMFPYDFTGKADLITFYLQYNGGSKTKYGGAFHNGDPNCRGSRDRIEDIDIMGFFSIPRFHEEKLPGLRLMTKYREAQLQTFSKTPKVTAFLSGHMPIAFDSAGDSCWLDMRSGKLLYMFWRNWSEGPVEISNSFSEFVVRFWNIERSEKSRSVSIFDSGLAAYDDGVKQFERATGLKYGTPEAIEYCTRKSGKS